LSPVEITRFIDVQEFCRLHGRDLDHYQRLIASGVIPAKYLKVYQLVNEPGLLRWEREHSEQTRPPEGLTGLLPGIN